MLVILQKREKKLSCVVLMIVWKFNNPETISSIVAVKVETWHTCQKLTKFDIFLDTVLAVGCLIRILSMFCIFSMLIYISVVDNL